MATAAAAATRPDSAESTFARDVAAGLSLPQKALSAKYFYDEAGSRLFDQICDLPEYYPTRTETGILQARAADIAAGAGAGVALIEFGSGSSAKVRLLLDALERPAAYVPIDISGAHMQAAAAVLRRDYPGLQVLPVEGDFTGPIPLPHFPAGTQRLGFFPGSTIGNFTPSQAHGFLAQAADTLGAGALFVVGVDLKKDPVRLEAAYNDAQGVTAAFNLNLLTRINRELGGDFDRAAFHHDALYNEAEGRIEMHIRSLRPQTVHVGGRAFTFREGETIHTENSYKYAVPEFRDLVQAAGWTVDEVLTDAEGLFALFCLSRA
jgi:dimethylhistidine N-methyltransferase